MENCNSQNPGIINSEKTSLSHLGPILTLLKVDREDEVTFLTSLFMYACMYISSYMPILEILISYHAFFQ